MIKSRRECDCCIIAFIRALCARALRAHVKAAIHRLVSAFIAALQKTADDCGCKVMQMAKKGGANAQ
jgi:hypothetical protein